MIEGIDILPDGTKGNRFYEGEYVQAYSLVQSFAREGDGALDPNDPVDIDVAHDAGRALAEALAGNDRYATVTTQIDGNTGCIHNHIVLDSVSKVDGKSLRSGVVTHFRLAKLHDEVLLNDCDLEQVNTLKKRGSIPEKSEERALKKYNTWEKNPVGDEPFSVAILKDRIRLALQDDSFVSLKDYFRVLERYGVNGRQRGEGGRGITYRMLRIDAAGNPIVGSRGDIRRASKLGADFMMQSVDDAIERNRLLQQQKAQMVAPTVASVGVVSELDEVNLPESKFDALMREYGKQDLAAEADELLAQFVADREERLSKPARRAASVQAQDEASVVEEEVVEVVAPGPTAEEKYGAQIEALVQADLLRLEEEQRLENEAAAAAALAVQPKEAVTSEYVPAPAAAASVAREVMRENREEVEEFVSRLHEVEARSQSMRERIAALAEYEDEAVPLLVEGGSLDETRLKTMGIGGRTVDSLGDKMHPMFRRQLQMRQKKSERARQAFEAGNVDRAKALRREMSEGNYGLSAAALSEETLAAMRRREQELEQRQAKRQDREF